MFAPGAKVVRDGARPHRRGLRGLRAHLQRHEASRPAGTRDPRGSLRRVQGCQVDPAAASLPDLRGRPAHGPDASAARVPHHLTGSATTDDENDESTGRRRSRDLGHRTGGPGRGGPARRTVSTFEQAQLVQINDNNGRLYRVAPRQRDGPGRRAGALRRGRGWPPPGLTVTKSIAIGELRTTDVLTIDVEHRPHPGKVDPLRRRRHAGRPPRVLVAGRGPASRGQTTARHRPQRTRVRPAPASAPR